MKPRAFKKSGKGREMRVAKTLTAGQALGTLEKGSDTFILTFGQFSLIDAIIAILDQVGPAEVDLSTWTAADAHLERTVELMESASITKFRLVVDRSFETRQPGYAYHMRKIFGKESIRAIRTHAKFAVIRARDFSVVVRTSMNLNENPRMENIEISENPDFAAFFTTIVDEIFAEVEPGENRSGMLDLKALEEKSPYKEINADQIKREHCHEVQAEFTLRKD